MVKEAETLQGRETPGEAENKEESEAAPVLSSQRHASPGSSRTSLFCLRCSPCYPWKDGEPLLVVGKNRLCCPLCDQITPLFSPLPISSLPVTFNYRLCANPVQVDGSGIAVSLYLQCWVTLSPVHVIMSFLGEYKGGLLWVAWNWWKVR